MFSNHFHHLLKIVLLKSKNSVKKNFILLQFTGDCKKYSLLHIKNLFTKRPDHIAIAFFVTRDYVFQILLQSTHKFDHSSDQEMLIVPKGCVQQIGFWLNDPCYQSLLY